MPGGDEENSNLLNAFFSTVFTEENKMSGAMLSDKVNFSFKCHLPKPKRNAEPIQMAHPRVGIKCYNTRLFLIFKGSLMTRTVSKDLSA